MTRRSGHDVAEIRSAVAWTGRRIKKDRVGSSRTDDRQAGKGTASPLSDRSRATTKTAVEMMSLWKPHNGFHRDLEISPRTRDSHIPTADSMWRKKKQREQIHTEDACR